MNQVINRSSKLYLTLLLTIMLVLSLSGLGRASVIVEPGRFIFTVNAGEKATGTIKVTNPSDKSTEVRAKVYDWTLDENNKLIITEPGIRNDSLDGFIKFNPHNFKLAPGASQTVRFTLRIPDTAKGKTGEYRGIVFFEEDIALPQNRTGAKMVSQVGTTIYLIAAPVKMSFRLLEAKVGLVDGNTTGQIRVINDGSAHIRYILHYKIINERGSLVAEDNLAETVILPGTVRNNSFPLKKGVVAGKYNLVLEIRFQGTTKTVVQNIPFTLTKGT